MENETNVAWFIALDANKQNALKSFYEVVVDMSDEDFKEFTASFQKIIDKMNL